MEEFALGTRIVAGAGAIAVLKEYGAKRVYIVTDPFFLGNGLAQKVAQAAGGQEVRFFSEVKPDPTVELAARGTAALKEFSPDLLVALGGGSALDCGKAMAYFSQGDFPLAAVPTTSGSGSEVTDFAVLTHGDTKYPLVDRRLRPNLAILDSDFLQELPPGLIADTGFDVLTHAVEGYTATGAGAFSDLFALEAFRGAYAGLPASYGGNRAVRLKIHLASTMAGLSFSQAGLGLCHAMSHALGARFHVPHGRLNAILLPAVMENNAAVCQKKYAQLARAAGLGGSADTVALRNLRNGLMRLRRELNLPGSLSQAGVAPGKVWEGMGEIVESVLSDPCCKTNPIPVEDFQVRRILEEVTGHF